MCQDGVESDEIDDDEDDHDDDDYDDDTMVKRFVLVQYIISKSTVCIPCGRYKHK